MVAGDNHLARVRVNELQHLQGLLIRFSTSSGVPDAQYGSSDNDHESHEATEYDVVGGVGMYSELGNGPFRPSDLQALAESLDLPDVADQMLFDPL